MRSRTFIYPVIPSSQMASRDRARFTADLKPSCSTSFHSCSIASFIEKEYLAGNRIELYAPIFRAEHESGQLGVAQAMRRFLSHTAMSFLKLPETETQNRSKIGAR
jgi:hypothetical protein